jgi:hypothetical protein
MFDLASAKAAVSRRLAEISPAGDPWIGNDNATIERSFGWIFFYNTARFVNDGNSLHRLAGNGPVFVNRVTEAIEFFGSGCPLESILEAYEQSLG